MTMIYVGLLGIPIVLLLVHMLVVLAQPPVQAQPAQRLDGHRAAPLAARGGAPGRPVQRPAGVVAVSPGQVIQMGLEQRRVEQRA